MKINNFETKEEWMNGRIGKITGSSLKDIITLRGSSKKIGYYQLIADRLAAPSDGENPIDRGNRLEEEAIEQFTEYTGKKVNTDLVIWERDDNKYIAISPDGYIEENGKIIEAVEVKCLASSRHAEAIVTGKVPSDYEFQVLQYFIVNEYLEMLHFVMYDPRFIESLRLKIITIYREDITDDIDTYLEYQRNTLKEVEDIVAKLTF